MSDVQALQASIGADVAQFLTAMQQSAQAVLQLAQAQQQSAQAAQHLGQATAASASSIGFAVTAYGALRTGLVEAARGAVEFGMAAINAANVIDPSSAHEWNAAVDDLHDSFMTLAAMVGRELRPALEGALEATSKMLDRLSNANWAALAQGFHNVGQAADNSFHAAFGTLGQQVSVSTQMLAKFGLAVVDLLTSPFRNAIAGIIDGFALLMTGISKELKSFGGSSVGKEILGRMGMQGADQEFAKWSLAMNATSVAVKAGFSEAAKSAQVAAKALNDASGGEFKKFTDSLAANPTHKNVNDAADLQKILGARNELEQMQAQLSHVLQRDAADTLRNAEHELGLKQQAADATMKASDYAFQEAMKQFDKAVQSGDSSSAAYFFSQAQAAGAKISEAFGQSITAYSGALEKAQNLQLAEEMKYTKARADVEAYQAKAEADLRVLGDKSSSQEARVIAQADYQHFQTLLSTFTMERRTRQEIEATVDNLRGKLSDQQHSRDLTNQKELNELQQKQNELNKQFADAQFKASMDHQKQVADTMRTQVVGLAGGLGGQGAGAIASGIQGGAAAGPAGMLFGGGIALLELSTQAKAFSQAVNNVVQSLADSVGKLLLPLMPVIQTIGAVYGPYWEQLGNLIGKFLGVLGTVLIPVMQLVSPVLTAVSYLFKGLAIALQALADGVRFVVDGIAAVWNFIVDQISKVLDILAHALPGSAGDAMRDVYNEFQRLRINTDGLNYSMWQVTHAVDVTGNALQEFMGTVQNTTVLLANMFPSTANAAAGQSIDPNSQLSREFFDMQAAAGTAGYAAAQKQYQQDADKAKADAAYAAFVAANNASPGSQSAADAFTAFQNAQQKYNQDLAQNSAATSANTKAVVALTTALTNTPTGFRVGGYEYGATAPTSSMTNSLLAAILRKLGGSSAGLSMQQNRTGLRNNSSAVSRFGL